MGCLQITRCVAIPERHEQCYSVYKRFTNVQVYFTFTSLFISALSNCYFLQLCNS